MAARAKGADGVRVQRVVDALRDLKAIARHHRRTLALASHRPRHRFARADLAGGGPATRWVEVRTPIMERAGPPDINANRLHNMELASQFVSDLTVGPGELFRFWRHVPRATRGRGFRTGFSLVHGRLRVDYGGGLCQVATTLFQAFLQADFEIVERSNHSVDAHGDERFFRLGTDAAVAYGYKDLIVRNPGPAPVRVVSGVDRDEREHRVTLYRDDGPLVDVEIDCRTLDSGAAAGEPIRVRVTRTSLRAGDRVVTYASIDTYRSNG